MTQPAGPERAGADHGCLDDQWVAAARAGSDAAFSRLVAAHQGAVRGFLRRVCGDPGLADDLAQEAFVTAWMSLRSFDGRSSFRAWVCGVAYRKHLTRRRGAMRALSRDSAWAEQRAGEGVDGAAPEHRMSLHDAMARLPEEQKSAVSLCLAGEFSHAEAAEVLGLPLGTVKSHVARGRATLLRMIGGRDD